MKINIEWITAEHECDTCGSSYAEGAIITFENGHKIELIPNAWCFNSTSYGGAEVYEAILAHLGHIVENDHSSTNEDE